VSTPVFQILETGTHISGQLLGAVATVLKQLKYPPVKPPVPVIRNRNRHIRAVPRSCSHGSQKNEIPTCQNHQFINSSFITGSLRFSK